MQTKSHNLSAVDMPMKRLYINLAVLAIMATWFSQPVYAIYGASIRLDMLSAILLLPLIRGLRDRNDQIRKHNIATRAGLLFITFSLSVSCLLAPQPLASVWMGLQVAFGFLFWYIITKFDSDTFSVVFKDVLNLGFTLVSTYLIFYFAVPDVARQFGWVSRDGRLQGFSAEPNILASQVLLWAIFMFINAKTGKVQKFVYSNIALAALFAAGTRTAWIGLALFSVLHLIYLRRIWWSLIIAAPVGLFTFVSFVEPSLKGLSENDTLLWRLLTVFDFSTQTAQYRGQIYSLALDDLSQNLTHLVFGSGINSFQQFHPIDPTNVGEAYLSSLFFQIIYDVGLLGLLLFLIFLVENLIRSNSRITSISVLIPILVAASATNLIWLSVFWFSLAGIHYIPINNSRTKLDSALQYVLK